MVEDDYPFWSKVDFMKKCDFLMLHHRCHDIQWGDGCIKGLEELLLIRLINECGTTSLVEPFRPVVLRLSSGGHGCGGAHGAVDTCLVLLILSKTRSNTRRCFLSNNIL